MCCADLVISVLVNCFQGYFPFFKEGTSIVHYICASGLFSFAKMTVRMYSVDTISHLAFTSFYRGPDEKHIHKICL